MTGNRTIFVASTLLFMTLNTGCQHIDAAKEPLLEGLHGELANAIYRQTSGPKTDERCYPGDTECERRRPPGGKHPLATAVILETPAAVAGSVVDELDQQQQDRQRVETLERQRRIEAQEQQSTTFLQICDDMGNCRDAEPANLTEGVVRTLETSGD